MSTLVPPRAAALRRRVDGAVQQVRDGGPLTIVVGLAILIGASLLLRSQAMYAKYWIDEGLSVSIAAYGFFEIPGVMRQDGSPPAYYMILHVWIQIFGDGEARTHALSLIFALACIPAAFWSGRKLFGPLPGWGCAVVAAFIPYLTYYAQETRMYALIVLLSILIVGSFASVFAQRERRAIPVFVLTGALAMYTHNWALFLIAATGITWLVLLARTRGEPPTGLRRDGLLCFGLIALLYAPWVPSLIYQAANTGAPWSETPPLEAIPNGLGALLGGPAIAYLAGFMGIAGVVKILRDRAGTPAARALILVLGITAAAVIVAWLASQVSPAWSNRYFAVFVGPLILLFGVTLTSQGRIGMMALLVVVLLALDGRESELKTKSNAFNVARTLTDRSFVAPGDLVVNTHPEHGPLLNFYLPDGLRYADALGPVDDPLIFDWADALERLRETGPVAVSRELLPTLEPGRRLILVLPIIRTARWGAPWTRLVRARSQDWERTLDHLPQLRRIEPVPSFGNRRLPRGVRAVVYQRTDTPAVPTAAVTPKFGP